MKNEFFLYKDILSIRSYTGGNSFFLIFLRHFFYVLFPYSLVKLMRVCARSTSTLCILATSGSEINSLYFSCQCESSNCPFHTKVGPQVHTLEYSYWRISCLQAFFVFIELKDPSPLSFLSSKLSTSFKTGSLAILWKTT